MSLPLIDNVVNCDDFLRTIIRLFKNHFNRGGFRTSVGFIVFLYICKNSRKAVDCGERRRRDEREDMK